MIFFLFIGSVLTLEFVLRVEARTEKKNGAKGKQQQLEAFPLPQMDFLALMQAVERKGGAITPAPPSPPSQETHREKTEAQRIEA